MSIKNNDTQKETNSTCGGGVAKKKYSIKWFTPGKEWKKITKT
jgi:hypothetical protein